MASKYAKDIIKTDTPGSPVGGEVSVDNVRRKLLKDRNAKVRKK